MSMKTRTLVIIISALLTYLLVGMLSSCRTKSITEYVAVHDTTYSVARDTVTKIKTDYSHDTLRIETERVIKVNEKGDTVFVALYKDRWRDQIVTKTDTMLNVRIDTIYVSKDVSHDKQTVVKKKSLLKPALIVAFLTLMTAMCIIIYHRKR